MKKYLCTEPTNFGCMAKTVIGFIHQCRGSRTYFLGFDFNSVGSMKRGAIMNTHYVWEEKCDEKRMLWMAS